MDVGEQRVDGHLAPLEELQELLERHPGQSVTVTVAWPELSKKRDRIKRWHVAVKIGTDAVFVPPFRAFDDATSFRLAAIELASTEGEA